MDPKKENVLLNIILYTQWHFVHIEAHLSKLKGKENSKNCNFLFEISLNDNFPLIVGIPSGCHSLFSR